MHSFREEQLMFARVCKVQAGILKDSVYELGFVLGNPNKKWPSSFQAWGNGQPSLS